VSVVFAEGRPASSTQQGRVLFYTRADRSGNSADHRPLLPCHAQPCGIRSPLLARSLRRAYQVYRRTMGTPVSQDVLVHEETDGRCVRAALLYIPHARIKCIACRVGRKQCIVWMDA
jgi:hypothetical protein